MRRTGLHAGRARHHFRPGLDQHRVFRIQKARVGAARHANAQAACFLRGFQRGAGVRRATAGGHTYHNILRCGRVGTYGAAGFGLIILGPFHGVEQCGIASRQHQHQPFGRPAIGGNKLYPILQPNAARCACPHVKQAASGFQPRHGGGNGGFQLWQGGFYSRNGAKLAFQQGFQHRA